MAKQKFPKTVGAAVDLAYKMREKRLAFQREMEAQLELLKGEENEIEQYIFQTFQKQDIEGAKGDLCSASVSRSVVPTVKDWDAVYAYIKKKGAWDLLERRMSRVAYRDRLDAGEEVPGTEQFVKLALSLRKIDK